MVYIDVQQVWQQCHAVHSKKKEIDMLIAINYAMAFIAAMGLCVAIWAAIARDDENIGSVEHTVLARFIIGGLAAIAAAGLVLMCLNGGGVEVAVIYGLATATAGGCYGLRALYIHSVEREEVRHQHAKHDRHLATNAEPLYGKPARKSDHLKVS